MKKQNTWLTIALGGLIAVTVGAAAIVWSGNRTKENPGTGLESTDRAGVPPESKPQALAFGDPGVGETRPAPSAAEKETSHFGSWSVSGNDPGTYRQPEPSQAAEANPAEEGNAAEPAMVEPVYSLNFQADERMAWPVSGNVIQYYSMDTTVYFPTLDQYRCSPAIEIQSEVGSPVYAPANARVTEIGENARIGRYVRLDLGNDYRIVLGQLTDLSVREGDYVARGTQIGTVAAPTRYYVVEGDNLYFQMLQGENTVDPLDYLE